MVGRPQGRGLDQYLSVEITRVCLSEKGAYRNAASMLYGAACRMAAAGGYRTAYTYTLEERTPQASVPLASPSTPNSASARRGLPLPARGMTATSSADRASHGAKASLEEGAMKLYLDEWLIRPSLNVYHGDAVEVLRTLGDESIQAVVTSPPYVDMRPEYGTPTDWLPIFQELARVVDGPMLWNVGRKWVQGVEQMWWLKIIEAATAAGWQHWDTLVWFKPNANPIQGRIATNAHEYILAFGREGMEFNEEARKRPYAIGSAERLRRRWVSSISVKDDDEERSGAKRSERRGERREVNPAGARGSSVLVHTTGKEKGINHPAPMALDLALELVEFATPSNADSLILDPFAGSGTTAIAARMRGIDSVMIELSPEYCKVLVERLGKVPRQMSLLT